MLYDRTENTPIFSIEDMHREKKRALCSLRVGGWMLASRVNECLAM